MPMPILKHKGEPCRHYSPGRVCAGDAQRDCSECPNKVRVGFRVLTAREREVAYTCLVGEAADRAFETMQADPTPLYLVFKPSTVGDFGKLALTKEEEPTPKGYELAASLRLPRSFTREQLGQLIRQLTGRLPLLPQRDEVRA